MPNITYGPYVKTVWQDGVTMGNQTRLLNLENQASAAIHSLNPDFSGPFVQSGIVASKDGTVANQLDVTSGHAYLTMSDGTLALIATVASTPGQFTTSTPSSTYHLYLQPDGTWYWNTASSPATNSLHIADVTTDASGNINVVTDVRHTGATLGMTLVVARRLNLVLTSTVQTGVTSINAPTTGFYRASMHFTYNNATPQKPIAQVQFFDPGVGTLTNAAFLMLSSASAGQLANGSQANTPGTGLQSVACAPITFLAKAGTSILVLMQDPGGTPNDTINATIERLS